MVAAPNIGTGARHGAREAVRGTAGLFDLIAQGVDLVSPYGDEGWGWGDKATGLGLAERAEQGTEGWVPPGYKPQTQAEHLASIAANAATSFAFPGMAGLGAVRGLPALKGGVKAYGKAATTDVGGNAARLAASNVGGSGAVQLAQEYAPDSVGAQLAAGLVGGVGGDKLGGGVARSIASSAGRNAARGVKNTRKTNSLGRLVDGLTRRMRVRMGNDAYTDDNVMEARDAIMQVLFGRTNRITDADLEDVLATQGMQAHNQLATQKQIMDDVFNEIEIYADLYDQGIATPTLLGILKGSDRGAGADFTRMARLQAQGHYNPQLEAANTAALERSISDIEGLRPAGATGDPADVQGAAIDARAASKARVDAPYQKPPVGDSRVKQLLDGLEAERPANLRVRPQDLRRVFENAARDTDLSPQARASIDIDGRIEKLLGTEGFVNPDGTISLSAYDAIRQELQGELRHLETPDVLKPYLNKLIDKIDGQVERRLRRSGDGTYEEYLRTRRDYGDHMDTYRPGEKMTRSERGRIDSRDPELKAGVANVLLNLKGNANEATADLEIANGLLKMVAKHDVRSVASQVRKVMDSDPDRLAEIEATLWNRVFKEAIDETSTHAQVKGAQTKLKGPARSAEESDLMALYRGIAGDDKADAVPLLIKRARSARADQTWAEGEAYNPNSGMTAMMGADQAVEGAKAVGDLATGRPSSAMRRIVMGAVNRYSENLPDARVADAIQMVQLNPRAFLELLDVPSKADYLKWESKWSIASTKAAARETAKGNIAGEIKE